MVQFLIILPKNWGSYTDWRWWDWLDFKLPDWIFLRSEKKWVNNARDLIGTVHQLKSISKLTLRCTGKTKCAQNDITESDNEHEHTRASVISNHEQRNWNLTAIILSRSFARNMEVPTPRSSTGCGQKCWLQNAWLTGWGTNYTGGLNEGLTGMA